MSVKRGREIRLAARPSGLPTSANFTLAEVDVPVPGPGEVVVRNTFMSVDPYMRGRMNDRPSYVAPFGLGGVLDGGAVGVVEESNDDGLPVGTNVVHGLGWRDYATGPSAAFRPIDTAGVASSAYLGVLGTTGFTAYIGLFVVDAIAAGETVFISSAAGAVGSIAGQFAKRRGARVIGSTRSKESAQVLRERLGFDDVIVIEPGNVQAQLRAAAPSGIDFYFDNVGGEQLEAALAVLNVFGRVSVCGMIAGYNEPVPGPRNMAVIVQRRLKITGFLVLDHGARNAEFVREIRPAVAAGEVIGLETFVTGLEAAPDALISLFTAGGHLGKLIVAM